MTTCISHFDKFLQEYNKCLSLGQCFCLKFINKLDHCCGESIYQDELYLGPRAKRQTQFIPRSRSSKKKCANACCDEKNEVEKINSIDSCEDSCCDEVSVEMVDKVETCAESCCDAEPITKVDSCRDEETKANDDIDSCVDSCCDKKPESIIEVDSCGGSCCGKGTKQNTTEGDPCGEVKDDIDSCGGSCCDKEPKPIDTNDIDSCCDKDESHPLNESILCAIDDPESQSSIENITLNVSGMTCSGCSKKINNVLSKFQGIQSINVQFVTGITEFSYDKSTVDLSSVLNKLSKETGFKYIKLERNLQTLEIITEDNLNQLESKLEKLVSNIEPSLDHKNSYKITFDPFYIGARDLFSKIPNAELAPPNFNIGLKEGKLKLSKLFWKCILALALAIPVCVLSWADPQTFSDETKSIVSLILASLVQFISITEFYIGALRELFYSKVLEMDMLVVISITAAYGYSLVVFILKHSGVDTEIQEIFETSSLLIALVLLGRVLSSFAKLKAIDSVSLRSLQVGKAIINQDEVELEIDSRLVQLGDIIVIPPHSRIVTDGVITAGKGSVDESMITGESIPVEKTINSQLIAGTLNGSSRLLMKTTRLPGINSISDIACQVENAIAGKPKVQELADKIASHFIPVVIGIGALVLIIWIIIGLEIRGNSAGRAISTAVTYSITVLAISCPCAVGLAVPMVLVIAGGVAARQGVIIKQSSVLERAFKMTDVVFDKTGTLTENKLVVEKQYFNEQMMKKKEEVINLVYSLTLNNEHPVSICVNEYLKQLNPSTINDLQNVKSIPGAGVQCEMGDTRVKLGNPYWCQVEMEPSVVQNLNQALSVLCLTLNGSLVANFGLGSILQPDAIDVVGYLQKIGITCHIVSGDNSKAVETVAQKLNISMDNVISRSTPVGKQEYIKRLKQANSKNVVLFCGDGTNDSVAIAQADIGVQVGTTSEVTKACSDVVLLNGLNGIIYLQNLSKKSFNRIVFNFAWSAVYNLFAILLSAGAFVTFRIPPAYAGLGEMVSIAPVIVAALTIYWTN